MYKLCQTEQSALRQRQLEAGLLDMMKLHRYEDISVSNLCDRMGIPRKSFYRYFSSKDGALFALLDHTMLEFFADADKPTHSTSRTALGDLNQFFLFWHSHADLLDALKRSSLSGILVERATALALREQIIPGYVRGWQADLQQIAVSFAVCGLFSMVIQWHQQGYKISPVEMSRLATALLTKPLIPT